MTKYRRWLMLGLSLCAALTMPKGAAVAPRQAHLAVSRLALEPCRLPDWNEDVRCGKYEVYRERRKTPGFIRGDIRRTDQDAYKNAAIWC